MKISYFLFAFLVFSWVNVYAQQDTEKQDSTAYRSIPEFIRKGNLQFLTRTYFMGTVNEGELKDDFAAATGVGFLYKSPSFHGFGFGTSSFYIFTLGSTDLSQPDSITNQINRYEVGLFDVTNLNRKQFGKLEQAYLYYQNQKFEIQVGKIFLNTPWINAQDGRMRPGFQEGAILNWKLSAKWKVGGGWLWGFSPRSTANWYSIANSIGTYPVGVNVRGTRSGYAGNVQSNGLGLFNLETTQKKWSAELWNYYLDNTMNTLFAQGFISMLEREKYSLKLGWQVGRQDRVGTGGNEISNFRYYEGKGTTTASFRIELKTSKETINLNANWISNEGRILFPREWGRDPFFTFLARERNEGVGNSFAISMNTSKLIQKKLLLQLSVGHYWLPATTDYRLNKYGMGDFLQTNLLAKYQFSGIWKGLEILFLTVIKRNTEEDYLLPRNIYNRVNLVHLNFIINYHFGITK
ncbi:MAG: hypothetical protein NZ108_03765 [Bacteroidia bacterium]|nr:hypothetical protein [Bacteroidia bacterium]